MPYKYQKRFAIKNIILIRFEMSSALLLKVLARTYQLFTDRPNKHSWSRELRKCVYDVADLYLETVTEFFQRTMFDGLSWKF